MQTSLDDELDSVHISLEEFVEADDQLLLLSAEDQLLPQLSLDMERLLWLEADSSEHQLELSVDFSLLETLWVDALLADDWPRLRLLQLALLSDEHDALELDELDVTSLSDDLLLQLMLDRL